MTEVADGTQRVYSGVCISAESSTDCAKADGSGTYKGAELIYKTTKGEPRTKCIPENALNYIPGAKAFIDELNPKEEFCMLVEKKGNFWNVKQFAKGIDTLTPAGGGQVVQASTGRGSFPSNTFPTPKDDKGIGIARQNALGHAVNIITLTKAADKKTPTEIAALAIGIARQLEAYTTGWEE